VARFLLHEEWQDRAFFFFFYYFFEVFFVGVGLVGGVFCSLGDVVMFFFYLLCVIV